MTDDMSRRLDEKRDKKDKLEMDDIIDKNEES